MMLFLKQENSATQIQLRFKELCGGVYPYTSVFEQERKVVSCAGVTFSFNSRMMAKKLAERGTKSRHGQERGHQRAFQPKIYATNTARCPVSFYKKISSHRPVEMNAPKSPFYLAVRHNRRSNEEVWYMKAPLGKNEIGKFLSTAVKNAGLHREGNKVTNHSIRKTCISRLIDADVLENFVAQLSGHKSTESLQSYKSASAKHQKRMSLTLSRAEVTGSRDEALSSVHNQGFEEVTRSTTDIVSSSTTTILIEQSSDPLLSSTATVFTGANVRSISGCTFQIFHGNVKIVQNERKRRIVIDSDEGN